MNDSAWSVAAIGILGLIGSVLFLALVMTLPMVWR